MSNPTVVTDIAPTDAATVVDTSAALLVDVREDREWAAGHSPNAIHIPWAGSIPPRCPPTDRSSPFAGPGADPVRRQPSSPGPDTG